MELVSIIVPVYNVQSFLKRCINSLVSQNYKNIEIILVDDGSTDDSGKICDDFANKYENVCSYHKMNGGVSSARNYGMKMMVEHGWLMFVDADDYVENDYVSTCVSLAETKPNSLISCAVKYENQFGSVLLQREENSLTETFKDENLYLGILNESLLRGSSSNKVYSKRILLENKIEFCQNIAIFEDLLFNIMYLEHVDDAIYIHRNLYHYIQNPNSAMHTFSHHKWKSALVALQQINSNIPDEYVHAKEIVLNGHSMESISYWIRMYKAGEYEKPTDEERIELKNSWKQKIHLKRRFYIYYFGIMHAPFLLYIAIRVEMLIRRIVCKFCR